MPSLTVLCPNAHRCQIPTTSGKTLREVFEEACMRQGYDANSYGLQFQRKFLDLSLPVRLSGLPNNATLELLKRDDVNLNSSIQVAIQGNFGRHIKDFPASTTLASILEEFTAAAGIDLLCRSDEFLIPSIGYMNKLWKGIDVLTQNTLNSIGMEAGSKALFRYSQISVTAEELEAIRQETSKEESKRLALVQIYNKRKAENDQRQFLSEKYQKESEQRERVRNEEEHKRLEAERQSNSMEEQSQQQNSRLNQLESALDVVSMSLNEGNSDNLVDQIVRDDGRLRIDEPLNVQPVFDMPFANFKFPQIPVATIEQLANEEMRSQTNMIAPERRPVIFERKPLQTTTTEEEESDEFFKLTTAEAKRLQKDLSEQVKQMTQQALLPKSFVEARNMEKKMSAYKRCVIRIRFGDNIFVQAQFLSIEPVDRLFDFVAGILKEDAPKFEIVVFLNEKLERGKGKNLLDVGLAPVSTINLKFNGGVNSSKWLLKPETVQECSSEEADLISREWLSENTSFKTEVFTVEPESESYLKKRNLEEPGKSNESVQKYQINNDPKPKWFKRQ